MASGPGFEARIARLVADGTLSAAEADTVLTMPGPEFVAPLYAFLASIAAAHLTGRLFRARGNTVEVFPVPSRNRSPSGRWRLARRPMPSWWCLLGGSARADLRYVVEAVELGQHLVEIHVQAVVGIDVAGPDSAGPVDRRRWPAPGGPSCHRR